MKTIVYSHTIAASFDGFAANKGKGHPVTPEPAAYGAIFLAICLVLVLMRRIRR